MKKTQEDYHYTESGLDNIVLQKITVYVCECGEEVAEIPAVECLHRAIADSIVISRNPLTGPEIKFLRKEMRYKANSFASILGVSKVTLSRWENNKTTIDKSYDYLIRLFYVLFRERQSKTLWTEFDTEKLLQGISKEKRDTTIVIPPEKLRECIQSCA